MNYKNKMSILAKLLSRKESKGKETNRQKTIRQTEHYFDNHINRQTDRKTVRQGKILQNNKKFRFFKINFKAKTVIIKYELTPGHI